MQSDNHKGRSTAASRLLALFDGSKTIHGRFIPIKGDGESKKQKGKVDTVRAPTTTELWGLHLSGITGLGVVPIRDDNSCAWAVIDIDLYPLDFLELLRKVEEYSLPLVCCKSKSGGAHLFIFLDPPVSAETVVQYLKGIVGILGYGRQEVFPKQVKLLIERGDVGNWLNMPYFGDTRKCVILVDGEVVELELEQFLDYAELSKTNLFIADKKKLDLSESPIVDGPPCLQTLSIQGFPPNTRNKGLFAVGVYAKRAYADNWKQKVEELNRIIFDEPLSSGEVSTVIQSLAKKDYFYQCHEEPLCSFCNASVCRTRKYGISVIANMPVVNSVTKLVGDSVVWFIDVEGGRLELNTDELFDNKAFQKKCMNELNIVPYRMATSAWTSYLQKLIETAVVIKQEDVNTAREQMFELFYQYCKIRVTHNPIDLEYNKVFYSEEDKEIWFSLKDFLAFLHRKRFIMSSTLVSAYLKEKGLMPMHKTFNKKSVRFQSIAYDGNIELMEAIFTKKKDDEGEVI